MAPSAGNALSLIKAVLELVADRRTGLLDVASEGLRTRIYFDDGNPVFAEDDAPGETFGRLLVRQGVIANADFVRVIDEMTRAAAGNSQLRFGEVAVALGVLTPEQVERGLGEQVCGIITRALARGESQWDFAPAPAAARPPRSFSLAINPGVLAALRQSPDRSMVADVVAARPEELVVVAGPRAAPAVQEDQQGDGGGATAETHAARMAAEQAFQKGLALLHETKNASAAIELRRASELQPESLEYLLYATWARARSYRETPTESDQQALLEIAQRAKRRDPRFAFASYVVGQLSMWSGDEAAAKKWFYEALRLDPGSEAAAQVRILARRATGMPAPPARGETASDRDLAPEPAPVPVSEPPPRAPVAAPAAKARPRPWAGRLAAGAALVVTALLIFVVARKSAPRAGLPPGSPASASPQPALSAGLPAPTEPERKQAAPAAPAATKPSEAAREQSAPEVETMGTVLLPERASGHRIFVDGRRAKSEGTAPLRLRCGAHVIQIGSSGTAESIDLPCGGEVQLE